MKKGFFFTIDVLMAVGVLVVVSVLVLSMSYTKPKEVQTSFFSEDIMDFMFTTIITDFNNEDVFKMWCSQCSGATHQIKNPDNTILEQLGEFFYFSDYSDAWDLGNATTTGLLNPQHSMSITISGTNKSGDMLEVDLFNITKRSREQSNLLIASTKLIYGVVDEQTIWGPYVVVVSVWQ